MKTLIAVLGLTLAATPALAQSSDPTPPAPRPTSAAAGAIPNTFDGPHAAATLPNAFDRPSPPIGDHVRTAPPDVTAAMPAPAAEVGPDVKRAEDALRAVVAGVQGDTLNYAMFSEDLGNRIRGQAATIGPLIKGFGGLTDVVYVGQEQGAELFALDFANARTQWIIGFNAEDEIALLLFRPAPAETTPSSPAAAPVQAPRGN
ncbi:MAG: hypothetical protein J0M36_05795 [Caulobacterales bacterium]|nr:hypothetical protein [Caulobacterales bacterium]